MIDPLAIGLTIEYIAQEDKDSENPTVWLIGALDSFTQSKLIGSFLEMSTEDGKPKIEKSIKTGSPDFAIVKYGLKGFKNFGTIEFRSEKVSAFGQEFEAVPDDILGRIPLSLIHELAGIIWKGNNINEDIKKK